MESSRLKVWLKFSAIFLALFLLQIGSAYASSAGNLPFNTTMDTFKNSFYAWVAIAAIILWIGTCLMLAFGEWGEGMKRIINILFWLSLALSGATAVPAIFGSGAVF